MCARMMNACVTGRILSEVLLHKSEFCQLELFTWRNEACAGTMAHTKHMYTHSWWVDFQVNCHAEAAAAVLPQRAEKSFDFTVIQEEIPRTTVWYHQPSGLETISSSARLSGMLLQPFVKKEPLKPGIRSSDEAAKNGTKWRTIHRRSSRSFLKYSCSNLSVDTLVTLSANQPTLHRMLEIWI